MSSSSSSSGAGLGLPLVIDSGIGLHIDPQRRVIPEALLDRASVVLIKTCSQVSSLAVTVGNLESKKAK